MSAEIYKLILVAGRDAGGFLQGQLTQDMERLVKAGSLPAAICNPKGRVISLLRLLMIDDGYGLVLPAAMAAAVCERLEFYRLRAAVGLEVAGPDWTCLVCQSDAHLEALNKLDLLPKQQINACRIGHGLTAVNVGIEEHCVELMGFAADFHKAGFDTAETASMDFLRGARIRAGIPEILAPLSEKFTPHMLNLDVLGAVSFDKGCYTGQEIIARTQFLGSSRRRLMRYSADAELSVGDKLFNGTNEVGEVINVVGTDLLGLTPVALHSAPLFANGIEAMPQSLPYALPNS